MAITAALVKELRERTGSGMMECKKALVSVMDLEGGVQKLSSSAGYHLLRATLFVRWPPPSPRALVWLSVSSVGSGVPCGPYGPARE